jgi:hypothetical protein
VSDLTRLRKGYNGNYTLKDIYLVLDTNISFPIFSLSLSRLEKEFCSPFSLLPRPPSLPHSFPKFLLNQDICCASFPQEFMVFGSLIWVVITTLPHKEISLRLGFW